MASITAANAIFTLAIAGLFPTPQQLHGFAADNIFETDPLESAEVLMGVDGLLSAGFVYVAVRQNISLQADSPSGAIFDTWWSQQQASKDIFFASGIVTLKSLGTKWAMTKGVLTTYPPIPNAARVLQPRRFGLTWQSVSPAVA